jgi:hypothetical protein
VRRNARPWVEPFDKRGRDIWRPCAPLPLLGGLPPKPLPGLVLREGHLETAAKLLNLLERVLAVFSKCALKSLDNQTDFDSGMRKFESFRPQRRLKGPFRTHGLRIIPARASQRPPDLCYATRPFTLLREITTWPRASGDLRPRIVISAA